MAELIPGACVTPENDSTNVEVVSVINEDCLFEFTLFALDDQDSTEDEYANWVHFGVGGPA
jgi:hypothetical protein